MCKNYFYCWDGKSWPAICHKLNKTEWPHLEGKHECLEARTTPKGGLSQVYLFILSKVSN